MPSYQESAEKINEKLKAALKGVDVPEEVLSELIDSFIWMGQVAKFRCRNNTAYENFVRLCLRDIAEAKYLPMGAGFKDDFETLRVTKVITPAEIARREEEKRRREAEREAMIL